MANRPNKKQRENPVTNINGANQYQLDPRQRLCWEAYANPKSATFGNGLQSAIKAGYEPEYANQITTTEWFKEKVRRLNLLSKAEKVLDEILDMPTEVLEWKGNGDDREQVVVTEPAIIKIKQDTAKFIASTQGKDEGYSTRLDHTTNGKDLPTPIAPIVRTDVSTDDGL